MQAAAASTGMGDRLRAGKPSRYFTKPTRPTQSPTLSGTENEYRPKCGDALRLGLKAGMVHSTWWQVKLCDPSLTCAIPERLRDEQIY